MNESNTPNQPGCLSRKQRAAATCVGMLVVTALSIMFYHYGQVRTALTYMAFSAIVYIVWVMLGKARPTREDVGDELSE